MQTLTFPQFVALEGEPQLTGILDVLDNAGCALHHVPFRQSEAPDKSSHGQRALEAMERIAAFYERRAQTLSGAQIVKPALLSEQCGGRQRENSGGQSETAAAFTVAHPRQLASFLAACNAPECVAAGTRRDSQTISRGEAEKTKQSKNPKHRSSDNFWFLHSLCLSASPREIV